MAPFPHGDVARARCCLRHEREVPIIARRRNAVGAVEASRAPRHDRTRPREVGEKDRDRVTERTSRERESRASSVDGERFFLFHRRARLTTRAPKYSRTRRTWKLISDVSTDAIVAWARDGASFTVRDPDSLPSVLPKRAGLVPETYGGFVRELSLYGFRCVASDERGRPVTFAVDHFRRDAKVEDLARVRRKANYGRSRRM